VSAGRSVSVSVVVPAYNAEAHLERAVDSVLAQTLRPTQVVLVDDASTDGTLAVMSALAARHPEVVVLPLPENAGPGHARNRGFDIATGDWIAVHDADDTASPGRFAAMVALGEEQHADLVLDNFVFVNATTGRRRASRIPAEDGWEPIDLYSFLRGARAFNYAPTWTLMQPLIRRQFLDRHGIRYPTHTRHGEDFLFMVELFLSGARGVRLRRPGYVYTERSGGLSTTRTDYSGLVQQTTRLLEDPRVSDDARAVRLLRRRRATLLCLEAERRGPAALGQRALTKPGVAATITRRAGRRALRVVRRPPPEPLPPLL
jgi:succinoglycan biosynthesis protein ExoO